MTKPKPVSDAQAEYLEGLCEQLGWSTDEIATMTRSEARRAITHGTPRVSATTGKP